MSELARFLFQQGHFSAKNQRVKPGAFNPGSRTDLSVFFVHRICAARKDYLASKVSQLGGRTVLGRAEVDRLDVAKASLTFERDDTPVHRHGNLIGWPLGDGDDARMSRVEIATRLANRASLYLP